LQFEIASDDDLVGFGQGKELTDDVDRGPKVDVYGELESDWSVTQ
jgi:hypothetical protein